MLKSIDNVVFETKEWDSSRDRNFLLKIVRVRWKLSRVLVCTGSDRGCLRVNFPIKTCDGATNVVTEESSVSRLFTYSLICIFCMKFYTLDYFDILNILILYMKIKQLWRIVLLLGVFVFRKIDWKHMPRNKAEPRAFYRRKLK